MISLNLLRSTRVYKSQKNINTMQKTFKTLPATSRLWIYTAERMLEADEEGQILLACDQFLSQWAAHGSELRAAAIISEHTFLIIAADESFQMASGCSIDSSVRFVKELGAKHGIDFFDRSTLLFKEGDALKRIKMNQINQAMQQGQISSESLFFNTTISTLGELNTNWPVKAEESWLKRYFKAAENV